MGELADKLKDKVNKAIPIMLEKIGDKLLEEFQNELDTQWDGKSPHPDPTPPWRRTGHLQASFKKEMDNDSVTVASDESIASYGKYLEAPHPFVAPIVDKIEEIVNPIIQEVLDSI